MNNEHATVQLFHGQGFAFEPKAIELPTTLQDGEVLVRITLATICGSDLHTVDGRRSAPTPCVLGHEAVGVVERSARHGVHAGQRVTWSIADSCQQCTACRRWQLPQKCQSLFKYGHASVENGTGLNGTYASHILLRPGTSLFEIPDHLPDAVVAPANCALATVIHAMEFLPRDCERVLVQGAGLLGLYACALLKQRGISEIYCSDLQSERWASVVEFGGVAMSPADAAGLCDLDFVLEVAGTAAVIPAGIAALRPGGHYVWAGMVHPQTQLEMTGESVIRKCLTLRGIHNYAPHNLNAGLNFLSGSLDRFPFDQLVGPVLSMSELAQGMEQTRQKLWPRIGLVP